MKFGCHKCAQKPSPGEDYNKTACAKCKLVVESYIGDNWDSIYDNHYGHIGAVDPAVYEKEITRCPYLDEMFHAMADAMQILLTIYTKYPRTYRVVMARLADPFASYSDIAKQFGCKKQNIQYHLDRFQNIYPELQFLIQMRSAVINKKLNEDADENKID